MYLVTPKIKFTKKAIIIFKPDITPLKDYMMASVLRAGKKKKKGGKWCQPPNPT